MDEKKMSKSNSGGNQASQKSKETSEKLKVKLEEIKKDKKK